MPNRRRQFLSGAAALSAAWLARGAALAEERFDLLIRGGEVIDPSQSLRARRDIGVRWGRIAALEPSIPPDRAAQVIDASGMLVVPGLVDLHAHVYPQGSAIGLPADELVPYTATTTYVSAGDAGANNFSALRHFIMAQARSRIFAFLHISNIGLAGFPVGETLNLDYADIDLAARTVAENRDVVLGLKVRVSKSVVGSNGLAPLERAIAAAQRAGGGARVMCHIGDAPGELPALLDLLRPGDILTHAYSGAGNNVVRARGPMLSASLSIAGDLQDPSSRRGRGQMHIRNASLYETPVGLAMLQLMNFAPPVFKSFDRVDANYVVDGDVIHLQKLAFRAPTLSINGSGTMRFSTLALDLDMVSASAEDGPDLGPLADIGEALTLLRDELISVKVKGTLTDPKANLQSLRGVRDSVDKVIGKPREKAE